MPGDSESTNTVAFSLRGPRDSPARGWEPKARGLPGFAEQSRCEPQLQLGQAGVSGSWVA